MNVAEIDLFARAACRGAPSELFVLPKEDRERTYPRDYDKARTYCKACPIRAECLEYAIVNHIDYGMYGGLTPNQRRRIRWRRVRAGLEGAT